jgi:hypothetical protein
LDKINESDTLSTPYKTQAIERVQRTIMYDINDVKKFIRDNTNQPLITGEGGGGSEVANPVTVVRNAKIQTHRKEESIQKKHKQHI